MTTDPAGYNAWAVPQHAAYDRLSAMLRAAHLGALHDGWRQQDREPYPGPAEPLPMVTLRATLRFELDASTGRVTPRFAVAADLEPVPGRPGAEPMEVWPPR